MLRKIATHNYVTGHVFTFVEYLIVAGVLAPFLAYYLTHGLALYAIIATGVVLNCLTMTAIALISVVRKEPSIGFLRARRDPELREQVAREHPDIVRVGLYLSVAVLIPFWIFAGAIFDVLFRLRH